MEEYLDLVALTGTETGEKGKVHSFWIKQMSLIPRCCLVDCRREHLLRPLVRPQLLKYCLFKLLVRLFVPLEIGTPTFSWLQGQGDTLVGPIKHKSINKH